MLSPEKVAGNIHIKLDPYKRLLDEKKNFNLRTIQPKIPSVHMLSSVEGVVKWCHKLDDKTKR